MLSFLGLNRVVDGFAGRAELGAFAVLGFAGFFFVFAFTVCFVAIIDIIGGLRLFCKGDKCMVYHNGSKIVAF